MKTICVLILCTIALSSAEDHPRGRMIQVCGAELARAVKRVCEDGDLDFFNLQHLQPYPNCTNDPYCAALAVQGYMRKFAQDCNGDGRIDCYDYMAIHKRGGYGCVGDLPFSYVNVFNQCVAAVANAQKYG